jgi:hypothetical protein
MLAFDPSPQANAALDRLRHPLRNPVREAIEQLCATNGQLPSSRTVAGLMDFRETIVTHPYTEVKAARIVFKVAGNTLRVPMIETL